MSQMSNAAARVIDPVLSALAIGYSQPELVGGILFPYVPVKQRGGKVIQFGKEDFMLYNTRRAPGTNTKRVQFGFSTTPISLESHSLEGTIPIETQQEAEAVPGINMLKASQFKVQSIIAVGLEKKQADLARNAALYAAANKITLSGTSQWSDYTTGVSDPIAAIETGKEAVRAKVGKRPNTVIMSALAYAKAKHHPKITDRLKYTAKEIATPQMLADLFGVDQVAVGESVWADDAGVFTDIWGKDVIVAYVDKSPVKDRGTPAYGYTYRLEGYPQVEQPYFERNPKTWMVPVTDEYAPYLVGPDSGYLITNAVA